MLQLYDPISTSLLLMLTIVGGKFGHLLRNCPPGTSSGTGSFHTVLAPAADHVSSWPMKHTSAIQRRSPGFLDVQNHLAAEEGRLLDC